MNESETSSTADDISGRPAREAGSLPPALRLGFTRGTAPGKWAERWRLAGGAPLELVPFSAPFGRGTAPGGIDTDVVLERTRPNERPEGSQEDGRTRHAVGLYTEALGLVVPSEHELAASTSLVIADLALVKLLDHPDHCDEWPDPEPWSDPAWMPRNTAAALEAVATGAGAILLPLPLARHMSRKRDHAVIPLVDASGSPVSAGTRVWASWAVTRDAADVQQLAGIMRGRTARSSRPAAGDTGRAGSDARGAESQRPGGTPPKQASKKAGPKPGSRGAQLAAAKEKAERARALKRKAKKRR